MRHGNRRFAVLIVALGAGFLYGLWKLYELRFTAGDIYPPYSSLRADPMGAKALYESLARIPGVSTSRNYRELSRLRKGSATVLLLGESPFNFETTAEKDVKELEALAAGGARVVIAMRPVSRPVVKSKPAGKSKPDESPSAIEKRWGVRFEYITLPANRAEDEAGANPKQTALYFRVQGKVLHRFEKPFGTGAVVLLSNCYPLSNQALTDERDLDLLAWAVGPNRHVIFDEHHLGISESGGIVTLARKFHLEGVAAMLLVLLALFIWKNSGGLLPAPPEQAGPDDSLVAKDARAGLSNLLRRNIPAKALLQTCLAEWENSRHGARFYPQVKIDRVRSLARRDADVVETYRKVSRILSDRSDA